MGNCRLPYRTFARGFTLLELLIVIAVLAIVAGGLLVAYDGLESKSAKGQSAFNLAAIDKGVRAFKITSSALPSDLDALLTDGTSVSNESGENPSLGSGQWYSGMHPQIQGLDNNLSTADGRLSVHRLTDATALAMLNAGIEKLRYINGAENSSPGGTPNRAFDLDELDGANTKGLVRPVAPGLTVPVVKARGYGASGADASNYLHQITGLDPNSTHLVVALGLGNNSTIVTAGKTGAAGAGFSEAPYYSDLRKDQYGRYLLLFLLGSDTDGNNRIDNSEVFSNARFIGVLNPKGDYLDAEYANYKGQQ